MTRLKAIAEQERLFPTTDWERVEGVNCLVHFQHRQTLPEICMDVRMQANGSTDPWPDKFLAEVVAMLQARLDTWQEPMDAMDKHVMGMVYQAIFVIRADEADRRTG